MTRLAGGKDASLAASMGGSIRVRSGLDAIALIALSGSPPSLAPEQVAVHEVQ